MLAKYQKLIRDSAMVILLILVVFVIDLAITKFRTNPAEDKATLNLSATDENKAPGLKIEAGQKIFIPILNFHHIDFAPAGLSKVAQSFYIEPDNFEKILNEMLNADYRPVFISEIVKFIEDGQMPPEKIIAITFDDGNEDFYTQAWPILQSLKIKSNMYVMTGVKGNDWLTSDQIKELDQSGLVEIGSHTVWHPYLTRINKDEQLRELKDSKEYLDKLLGKNINVICYPFGLYNQQIEDLANQSGYEAGLTFDQDAWQNPENLMELKRISVYPGLNVTKFLDKLNTLSP